MCRICRMHGEKRNATEFWLECLKVENHWEHLCVYVRIILKWMLGIRLEWIGFTWPWIRTGSELLWTQKLTFVFHKRWWIPWLAERLLASPWNYFVSFLQILLRSDIISVTADGWQSTWWRSQVQTLIDLRVEPSELTENGELVNTEMEENDVSITESSLYSKILKFHGWLLEKTSLQHSLLLSFL